MFDIMLTIPDSLLRFRVLHERALDPYAVADVVFTYVFATVYLNFAELSEECRSIARLADPAVFKQTLVFSGCIALLGLSTYQYVAPLSSMKDGLIFGRCSGILDSAKVASFAIPEARRL